MGNKISIGYLYERGNFFSYVPARTVQAPALDASLSRHHIISYPYIYFIGTALMVYYSRCRSSIFSNIPQQLNTIIEEGANRIGRIDGNTYSLGGTISVQQNRFAWLPWNLFIGPAGKFRFEDPSQGVEKNLPLKMPNRDEIENLNRCFKSLGAAYLSDSAGDICPVTLDENKLENFARSAARFLSALKQNNLTPYDSLVEDWVLAENSSSKDKYGVFFPENPDAIKDKREDINIKSYKFGVKTERKDLPNVVRLISKSSELCRGRIVSTGPEHRKQGEKPISGFFPRLHR